MIKILFLRCETSGFSLSTNVGSGSSSDRFCFPYICEKSSVPEPVHFCAAPAPACQKFRLQLGLFSPYNIEKFNDFHCLKNKFMFF
jgi:hypothetical protein